MERVRWFQFISAAILRLGTLYYALQLWAMGLIGVGEFTMTTGLALLIIGDARNLSRRFLEFFEYIGTVSNGVKTLIRPHELVDSHNAGELNVRAGRIEFRSVSFAYAPEQWVFKDMNIIIPSGQRVGLVGLSGSGKSTFANLILRNFDPQHGQILIDDVDIATVTQDSLHRHVSLIPQDPTLFHRTLRENIAYGKPEATPEELMEAARLAQADEFILKRPEQYEALVGERGVKLSGGQRQRIAIARVLLRQSPILILDEATSSLDSITEKAIQDSLEKLMRGKTVIVIAHRLSTIANLDRILVFDQGRIVEDGTHDDLLNRQGAYYRLWAMQSAGFLPDHV
ncbi:MAG: ABC transporter ATP-binding protein [Methylococcaceae bacterium]